MAEALGATLTRGRVAIETGTQLAQRRGQLFPQSLHGHRQRHSLGRSSAPLGWPRHTSAVRRAGRRRARNRESASSRCSRLGDRRPTELLRMAYEVSDEAAGPRVGHAALHRRADLRCAPGAWRSTTMGHNAISLTGSPGGDRHGLLAHQGANPSTSAPTGSRGRSTDDRIVLVAGFQGVSATGSVTTLDAAARTPPRWRSPRRSGAEVCEIYTDVAACSAPIRASPRTRASIVIVRGDARAAASARRCFSCARWNTPATTASRSFAESSFEEGTGNIRAFRG